MLGVPAEARAACGAGDNQDLRLSDEATSYIVSKARSPPRGLPLRKRPRLDVDGPLKLANRCSTCGFPHLSQDNFDPLN